jgi:hypothetical protein
VRNNSKDKMNITINNEDSQRNSNQERLTKRDEGSIPLTSMDVLIFSNSFIPFDDFLKGGKMYRGFLFSKCSMVHFILKGVFQLLGIPHHLQHLL